MSAQTALPDEAEPQHITKDAPCSIDGSLTQTSDSPFVFHVSISNGRPAPSMPTKHRSEPASASTSCEYRKPGTAFVETRTRTGKSASAALSESYPATVSCAPQL